jgi:hypothetical protein
MSCRAPVSVVSDLEAAKADARNGLKTLIAARSSMKRLGQLEQSGDFRAVLALLEDLCAQCPSCAVVHASKCNVLCKLQKWTEAKDCAEDFVCTSHSTIMVLTAHPKAVMPAPIVSRLRWVESAQTNSVAVEVAAVVQAVLCMGAELARPYVIALKNIEGCPNSCSDALLHVLVILTQLSEILSANTSTSSDWSWVARELKCSKDSAHWKELGDKQFRTACLAEACMSYTHAINADPQAVRWSAILFKCVYNLHAEG